MADPERMTIRGVAAALQRSDRTIRRYIQKGLLDAERVDMDAGGWRYLITRASMEGLKERLAGGKSHALSGLTAQVQALGQQIDQLTEEIRELRDTQQRLLPAAPEEPTPRPGLLRRVREWLRGEIGGSQAR